MTGGKYKRYSEYKCVASEWMSEVPKHWEVSSLKSVLVERKENNRPIKTTQILSLTMEKGVVPYSERGGGGNKHKDDLTAYRLAYPNDIVLNSMNVVVGSVGLSKYFGAVSPVYYMLRPRREEDRVEFFSHIFQSKTFQQSLLGLGNGIMMKQAEASGKLNTIRMRIPMGKLNTQLLPRPSVDEQTQIAKFLDHETAKIDALIEKQQQLIALLKEKRQAVISHAVTKGLNPDAPMRDSGVEWLGEVPAHWATAKLGHRYEVLLGKMLDARKISGDHLGRYLRNTDVQWDRINEDDLPEMDFRPHERERYSVRKGDLIVCEGGEIGRCAIWTKDYPCFYQKALHRLRPRHPAEDVTRFMFYHLFLAVVQERFIAGSEKATIAHLPAESFRQYRFTFPPHDEQRAIADALDAQAMRFDELEAKAQEQIELLQERRTALISAAVTGKIDVRGWRAPDAGAEVA